MEIKNAKIIELCDAKEGVNKQGNAWRKVTAAFETSDHYPKTVAVTCFNAMCETVTAYTPGAMLNVTFDIESRRWQDPKTGDVRYFTEATARTIVPSVVTDTDKPLPPINEAPAQKPKEYDPTGDLPF